MAVTGRGPEVLQLGQPLTSTTFGATSRSRFVHELFTMHAPEGPGSDRAPGVTVASDRIATDLHVGTHVDSLSHVALNGTLHDGTEVSALGAEDPREGIAMRSGSGLRPIVAPGFLLDLPSHLECDVLPDDHEITATELLGCAERAGIGFEPGGVALIRTGFDTFWDLDPERYFGGSTPGLNLEAARLLRSKGVVATGSDTFVYEAYPSPSVLAVHADLLVKGGVFIIENLRLSELARRAVRGFEFIALPLNLPRATGSPVNPVAVIHAHHELPSAL
jgi:kynurenine formamidase